MAISTLERLELRMGFTPGDNPDLDTLLTMLLGQAESVIMGDVSCVLDSPPVAATEYYRGNGTNALFLRRWPVVSVSGVWVWSGSYWNQGEDAFPTESALVEGRDYALDIDQPDGTSRSGILFRLGCNWPARWTRSRTLNASPGPSLGDIKVTYTAGWPTLPADLEMVLHRMVTAEFAGQLTGGLMKSESFEGGDYSYVMASAAEAAAQAGSSASILSGYYRPTL